MKRVVATAAAVAICAVIAPAIAPSNADAATSIVQTSSESSHLDGESWVKDYSSKDTYNKKAQGTKSVSKMYEDGKLKSTDTTKRTFDKQGRLKTEKYYTDGKFVRSEKYSYSGSKQTVKEYNSKGKFQGKTVSKSTKKAYESKHYNAKGKVESRYTATFNSKGEFKSSKFYDQNGKLTNKTVSTFKNGKKTKTVDTFYENGKKQSEITTKHSYSGKYTIDTSYENGVKTSATKYYDEPKTHRYTQVWYKAYDSDGKVLSQTTYKFKKYTSGKLKGIIKESVGYSDGVAWDKTKVTYKVIKH